LPSPSYWPIMLAFSLPLICYGLIYSLWFAFVGGVLLLASMYGWGLEPSVDPDTGHGGDHHDDHHDDEPTPDPAGETAVSEVGAAPAPGA
ncbi:MAG: cytochrome c oxidase subunit 4, partial [Acidimicrobiales bacterium]